MTDKEIGTIMKIGILDHPRHGQYFIWHDDGFYGITKDDTPPHCAYSSLEALLKQKGLENAIRYTKISIL